MIFRQHDDFYLLFDIYLDWQSGNHIYLSFTQHKEMTSTKHLALFLSSLTLPVVLIWAVSFLLCVFFLWLGKM